MKTSCFSIRILVMVFLVIATGCAMSHQYIMRGQIIEASNDGVYLCIGSKDGAEAGQVYTVNRFVLPPQNQDTKYKHPSFVKEEMGTVKITEIVDEHYAKAKVLTGEAKINYMVELKK
jgi:hypothetical protein